MHEGAEGGYIWTVFLDKVNPRHSKSSFNTVQHKKDNKNKLEHFFKAWQDNEEN